MKSTAAKLLFLLGVFSMTQIRVIGSIGISELVIFIVGPWICLKDWALLRRDGFLVAVNLILLTCVGCVIACLKNHTPFAFAIRGFAAPYALFCVLVVGHRLIRKAPNGLKWFVLGLAISWTINIFIFQRGVESAIYAEGKTGVAAAEGVMSSPIFWVGRINAWINVLVRGWYLTVPTFIQVLLPIFMFFFAALTTESGRSAAAAALGAVMFVVLGGKTRMRMKRLSSRIVVVSVVALVGINMLTSLYKYAATQGLMGERAQTKYERQMRGRKGGVIDTLMGGRIEFFVGAFACVRNPLIGYGPWAVDHERLYESFMLKYGTDEDIEDWHKSDLWFERIGVERLHYIPGHSHIIGFWICYGIAGLIFWLYVLKLIWQYFRFNLSAVPQWYGFLAVGAPSFLWSVFFSPLGDRIPEGMFIVCLLAARAVAQGRMLLPFEMYREMEKIERKGGKHGAFALNRHR